MDEDAGRMRLVLAAESKARREEEQLELAEKNAEMCGASPFGSSCTHTFPSLVPLSSLQRTAFCVDSHGSPRPFHPLTWLPPPVQARDDQAYACRLPHP